MEKKFSEFHETINSKFSKYFANSFFSKPKLKGILVILDGLGDLPNKQLNCKTPLDAAKTPNLDFLAARGEIGYMYPVKPGFIPGSDEAIVSIFGNELKNSTRGQLEARGTNINLKKGDLAMRVNFATIDSLEKGNIIDRRAGRTLTTKEANALAEDLNNIKLPCEFEFISTVQHRGVLVLRGNFSDRIFGNDSHPSTEKIKQCKTIDNKENSKYTINVLNEFLEKAYEVLDKHEINMKRKSKRLMPANYLLVRGAGTDAPKLKLYKKWISVSYMPLEIGFSKTSGMKVFSFNYPKLKNLDAYKNLWDGLKKMCRFSVKILKKNYKKYDYAYIHIKETDLPGHDNKPIEKKLMIEHVDKTLFKFLRKFAPYHKVKVVVTGDHSTPCKLKAHSSDPVPVLFYNDSIPKEKKFCEKEARKGTLGRVMGNQLLKKVGFVK